MDKIKYAKKHFDPDELRFLYWDKQLTVQEIADKLKTTDRTIIRNMRRFNIPCRSLSQRIQLAYDKGTLDRKGPKASKWKGGRNVGERGYVSIYIDPSNPFHCMCRKGTNSIDEHRLVMAQKLGRPLLSYELVHHINGITGDNRIENLELTVAATHGGITRHCTGCRTKHDLRLALRRIRYLESQFVKPLSLHS